MANAEGLVSYCARVSNPQNQDNPDYEKLLGYCFKNKHFSVFEMVNAVVEVEAPRDITRQLLRHRSFSFQEFSQRYSDQIEFTDRDIRRQDTKNRQNSVDDLEDDLVSAWDTWTPAYTAFVEDSYKELLGSGVAKECARVILPEGLTMSRLYVNGTLRSWLTYLDVRDDPGVTQWEHVLLAREIRKAIAPAFPTVFKQVNDAPDL
ncbi:THY1 Predicted alternative thymidylate synthase [uncultured Caudovirales phage]|uniref:THY1 Predicted alternative thymidylate synthase n=1 Tax=uncultured Caudovirales phage TaxID=2100421 RepID=A0A6J7WRK7_9CAUD|nr:THY1 Predicted alternative thymidylate synthase [uncultured Caudovirales phage]CAB5220556.1 THY1 Predicted alternative thymidylate synthase [uncultured Caudovirales phage]